MATILFRFTNVLALTLITLHSLNAQTAIWQPALQVDWQWQLTGEIDLSVDAAIFDVDLFNVSKATVDAIHAKGAKAICYVSVGTFEPWRPDATSFPAAVKGKPLGDFPDETWLDIRRLDVLGPIMEARFDLCKAKGFDGVEPDNVDGYTNKSGFPLTATDQLKFNKFLATAAHARGLSVGLKNDLDQIKELVDTFDWALNEQCFQYQECGLLRPFTDAGKAVFTVEYKLGSEAFCPQANALNFNTLRKNLVLDAFRVACRKAQVEAPLVKAIVNSASYSGAGLAPGSLVTIFGTAMGPSAVQTMKLTAGGSVESTLDNTRVLWDGVQSPIIYLSSGQAAVSVPYGTAGKGKVDVQIERNGVRSAAFKVDIAAASPGIFTAAGSGTGQAAMLNQNATLNGVGKAAKVGEIVVFYATGEGQTSPGGVDGVIIGNTLSKPVLPVKVEIGGRVAEVLYAGSAPGIVAGVMQVNVRVPAISVSNSVPVILTVGTQTSQGGVTMAVGE